MRLSIGLWWTSIVMMDVGDCIMLRILIVDVECDLWCQWLIMTSGDQIMLLMLVEDLWYDYVSYIMWDCWVFYVDVYWCLPMNNIRLLLYELSFVISLWTKYCINFQLLCIAFLKYTKFNFLIFSYIWNSFICVYV